MRLTVGQLPKGLPFEMLEPYDGKLSRTVLRGESGREPRDLLGVEIIYSNFYSVNMDEIAELKILTEQLETCIEFIDEDTVTKYRIVIILLDNLAEILLLRCYKPAFESDDFSKWIMPPEFDIKKRNKVSKSFEEKVKLAENKNNISNHISCNLNICHKYRNSIYHRDIHNESTINIIAKIFFISVCELFKETASGYEGLTIGGFNNSFEWLNKYDHKESNLNFTDVTNLLILTDFSGCDKQPR